MDEPRLDSLDHRLRALEGRLRAVEARLSLSPAGPGTGVPAAAPPDPGGDPEPLQERLQQLGERVYALEAHAPARMAEALLRVEARLAELERPPGGPPPAPDPPRRRGLRFL